MAKKIMQEPVREVAHIVYYLHGLQMSFVVRYHKMTDAKKQFDGLLKARDQAKTFTLTGPASTAVIADAGEIATCMLVDVETSNFLMADTQKRMNAMMQMP